MSNGSDVVFVEALEVEASIGVFDWEKQVKQRLVFDLALFTDFSLAAASDDVVHAIDYAKVSETIISITQAGHIELLECLAEKISEILLQTYPMKGLELKISKPGAVPQARNVGVKISRYRQDNG